MTTAQNIVVCYGDGVGPEIMDAALYVIKEAGAKLSIETVEMGEEHFEKGQANGIPPWTWRKLCKSNILLKAPTGSPTSLYHRHMQHMLRRALGTYVTLFPVHSFQPESMVPSEPVLIYPACDSFALNFEYQEAPHTIATSMATDLVHIAKMMQAARDYADQSGKKRVGCVSFSELFALADGAFEQQFARLFSEEEEIETGYVFADQWLAYMRYFCGRHDIILLPNLYGELSAEMAANLSRSPFMSAQAHIGDHAAIFEPTHPLLADIAGMNQANPTGMIQAAIMMMAYLGQYEVAVRASNGLRAAIEDGFYTQDMPKEGEGTEPVTSSVFTEAIVERITRKPKQLRAVSAEDLSALFAPFAAVAEESDALESGVIPLGEKRLVGVDIFVESQADQEVEVFASELLAITETTDLKLQQIIMQGLRVWPAGVGYAGKSDVWQCRFIVPHPEHGGKKQADFPAIIALQQQLQDHDITITRVQSLYVYGDQVGFSMSIGDVIDE